MSSRHHPLRADDWTATYVTAPVLIRYLKALLMGRFTGKTQFLGRKWTLNMLRILELSYFFLDVKNPSFTWYGNSSIFTGRPPTFRPSRRRHRRMRTASEKMSICDRIYKDIYCYIHFISAAICETNFNWKTNKQKTNWLSTWNSLLLEKLRDHLLVYKFP